MASVALIIYKGIDGKAFQQFWSIKSKTKACYLVVGSSNSQKKKVVGCSRIEQRWVPSWLQLQ
jgi:hypothetical protein